jgi:hypothetical protein
VRLRFVQKPDKDSAPLREGPSISKRASSPARPGPERAQALFSDRFVGVVRRGHPLGAARITLARYAASRHVVVSRRGVDRGPIDEALAPLGFERTVVAMVGTFSAALALARESDLVASVPGRHTGRLRVGMSSFTLPVPVEPITISLLWPGLEAILRIAGCAGVSCRCAGEADDRDLSGCRSSVVAAPAWRAAGEVREGQSSAPFAPSTCSEPGRSRPHLEFTGDVHDVIGEHRHSHLDAAREAGEASDARRGHPRHVASDVEAPAVASISLASGADTDVVGPGERVRSGQRMPVIASAVRRKQAAPRTRGRARCRWPSAPGTPPRCSRPRRAQLRRCRVSLA